jgi:nucleoid-associated protein YgaU
MLLVRPAAGGLWAARTSLDALPLDRAMVDLAAFVLLGCVAWGWLALSATVVEAWRGIGRARRPWHLPGVVRRVVLAACGVALATGVAAPAVATSGASPRHLHGALLLTGLPLPDRAVVSRAAPTPRPRHTVVVRQGDSLWSIAQRHLPPDAAARAIVRRWQAIYAANRALLGPNPDVIEPGQRLHLPPDDPPRKDRP